MTTRHIKRTYWNRKTWFIYGPAWAVILAFWAFGAWGWWVIPVYVMDIVINSWAWQLGRDWREMYCAGMRLADRTTVLASRYGRKGSTRYATLKNDDRKFPRILWVLVAAHTGMDGITSVRVYQGFSFRNQIPEPRRIVKSRIYRQVA